MGWFFYGVEGDKDIDLHALFSANEHLTGEPRGAKPTVLAVRRDRAIVGEVLARLLDIFKGEVCLASREREGRQREDREKNKKRSHPFSSPDIGGR